MNAQAIVGSASRRQRKLGRLGAVGAALIWLVPLTGATSALVATTTTASAALITTFSSTVTIPIPPASNYAGAGGGDGWSIALSNTQVFNVFHHNFVLQVSCHNQSDASACYPVRTITDGSGNNFVTSGHPGMFLDQNTGKLYVYVNRPLDSTGGVACVDTTVAAVNPNPFCGYTALTAVNDGPPCCGYGGLSNPIQFGTKLYAYNFVSNSASAGGSGGQNTLLCFDLTTFAACAGQPITVNIGAGTVAAFGPTPAIAGIGAQIVIPIVTGGNPLLACWDASTGANCSGAWPAAAPINYPGNAGAPFAELDPTGKLIGLCLPTGTDQCYSLMGASVATPSGMTAAIGGGSVSWDGTGLVLGPRVYVPAWTNVVYCYDASTSASCANFPKFFNNLSLLYTVNPDPQRPTCIWVNADNGSAQIQNFDAYTGAGCGQGAIRVLASQFVVNTPPCLPATFISLQVLQPLPSTYTSGTVQFLDGGGNPIPGAANRPLDATGTVDLTGLNLTTATGLPQFLITLTGATGNPGQVVVKLTWTGNYDPNCIGPGTTTTQVPTTVATMLSGGGQSGGHITVPAGTQVTDTATLQGGHAGSAGGTVTYTVYSDNTCTTVVQAGSPQAITTPGTLPSSAPFTMNSAGIFYLLASYSGDGANFPSTSNCLDETLTVTPALEPPITNATGVPFSAVEGANKCGSVATFDDADQNAVAGEYTAMIAWGDTTSSAGTVSGGSGHFTASGCHTYVEEGAYQITVTITDADKLSNTATVNSTANVVDAALNASPACVNPSPLSYNGPTATFTDAAFPSGTLSDFSATIKWGDASPSSTGTISGPIGGVYTVTGTHTYATTGKFTITTTINDVGGSTATVSCGTLAFAFAPGGGSFAIGDQNAAVGTSVTFWGAQWAKLNSLSGGNAPASFKGFAENPTTPNCGASWTADTGSSTPPPAGPLPAFMGVIVTSQASESGSTDSGTIVHIVVVQTNPDYAPDSGHAGTGIVVAVVC